MTALSQGEYLPQDPREGRVRHVLIVGGGSSGWMAAAMLSTALAKDIAITLVESDAIGTVGVGEATIPPMQKFQRFLGMDERALLAGTQGTYKLGIEFHNWGREGDRYLHQFGAVGRELDALVKLHHWWLAGRLAGGEDYPEWQAMHVAYHAAMANRFAPSKQGRKQGTPELANRYTHAYHFDASFYAAQLRSLAESRRVRRVEGTVAGVDRDGESGFVSAVVLQGGQRLEADLFIDCTGFRSFLLGGELAEPWTDWSHWIPSDRALAVSTARAEGPLKPYTQGIAHSVGWQWRIPLQHRTGNGHVFSSTFSSEAEAETRLKGCLDADPLSEPRLIKFNTGRRARAWVGNVVALGLASGFLEPLESTSIHFVQSALERLVELFPTRAMDLELQHQFNARSCTEWEQVRDFIIAHYHLTEREDSEFWRYTRHMAVPDSLAEILEAWRARGVLAVDGGHLFQLGSWASLLLGQRCIPRGVHALTDRAEPGYAAEQMRAIAAECRAAAERLPLHADFIAANCAASA